MNKSTGYNLSPIGKCKNKEALNINLLSPKRDTSFLSSTRITPNKLSPRYSLSDVSTQKLQTNGPLLASASFNLNMGTYADVKSPGLSSRIVQYNKGQEQTTHTHQTKYGSPGLFPIVHFFKKDLPVMKSKRKKVMVRLASQETVTSCNGSGDFTVDDIQNNSCHDSTKANINTKSVLDALKEISRKRIHAGEEYHSDKDVYKRTKRQEYNINEYSKRTREDSPTLTDGSSSNQSVKRLCIVDPVYASNTSYLLLLEKGKKRKVKVDDKTSTTENKQIKLLNAETQTIETKLKDSAVPEDSDTTTGINSKETNKNEKFEQIVTPIKVFDDKLHEIHKKNKLATILSKITGKEPVLLPLKPPTEKPIEVPKEKHVHFSDEIDSEIKESNAPLVPTIASSTNDTININSNLTTNVNIEAAKSLNELENSDKFDRSLSTASKPQETNVKINSEITKPSPSFEFKTPPVSISSLTTSSLANVDTTPNKITPTTTQSLSDTFTFIKTTTAELITPTSKPELKLAKSPPKSITFGLEQPIITLSSTTTENKNPLSGNIITTSSNAIFPKLTTTTSNNAFSSGNFTFGSVTSSTASSSLVPATTASNFSSIFRNKFPSTGTKTTTTTTNATTTSSSVFGTSAPLLSTPSYGGFAFTFGKTTSPSSASTTTNSFLNSPIMSPSSTVNTTKIESVVNTFTTPTKPLIANTNITFDFPKAVTTNSTFNVPVTTSFFTSPAPTGFGVTQPPTTNFNIPTTTTASFTSTNSIFGNNSPFGNTFKTETTTTTANNMFGKSITTTASFTFPSASPNPPAYNANANNNNNNAPFGTPQTFATTQQNFITNQVTSFDTTNQATFGAPTQTSIFGTTNAFGSKMNNSFGVNTTAVTATTTTSSTFGTVGTSPSFGNWTFTNNHNAFGNPSSTFASPNNTFGNSVFNSIEKGPSSESSVFQTATSTPVLGQSTFGSAANTTPNQRSMFTFGGNSNPVANAPPKLEGVFSFGSLTNSKPNTPSNAPFNFSANNSTANFGAANSMNPAPAFPATPQFNSPTGSAGMFSIGSGSSTRPRNSLRAKRRT